MTRRVELVRLLGNDREVEKFINPPEWLVPEIAARGDWPGMRPLVGVMEAPFLRADGSVCQAPGYDAASCVVLVPSMEFPAISTDIDIDDATAAIDRIMDVVCDFKFEAEAHRSAWMAALLTPLARHAFDGVAPLFLVDANVRGAGKGLLVQVIGEIVLGRPMPVSSYIHDSAEMRKLITAIAIDGDRLVLLDNLEGTFGNGALDRALTAPRWKDRLLGTNEQVDLPLLATWYGTGNNFAVGADTARRLIHIRLDVLEERPEERKGFRYPDLLGVVRSRRADLVSAGLTILAAYLRTGAPDQGLSAFGSFEGWSRVVRGALVWAGLQDPVETRQGIAACADAARDCQAELIRTWRECIDPGQGVVIAELLPLLYGSEDESSVRLRGVLEALVGCQPGKQPGARQVGRKFAAMRRRVFAGSYIDSNPNEHHRRGAVWRLHRTEEGASTCN